MVRLVDRLFWTEEQQAKTDQRFARARELRDESANTHIEGRVRKNVAALAVYIAVGTAAAWLSHQTLGTGSVLSSVVAAIPATFILLWLQSRGLFSRSWRESTLSRTPETSRRARR
jgi:hypothetical protein